MSQADYLANGGQTYLPFQDNIHIKTQPYTPAAKPVPPIPELVLNDAAVQKGWVLQSQEQHLLPGVTSAMLDWFWANMEKGYYLWAPGSHKRFNWVKEPWRVGFLHSVHMISESVGEGCAVFGGSGIEIHRLGLDYFPFTSALPHVIVEGTFNDLGEFVDMTVHMWEDSPAGCRHITGAVASTTAHEPPHFVKEMLAADPGVKLVPPSATDHAEYEASMWPRFLPALYQLWSGHPDPTQSVPCDLTVRRTGPCSWAYVRENGPTGPARPAEQEEEKSMLRPLHQGISVPDMDASVEWYQTMLGFEALSDEFVPPLNARIVFLARDGWQLELFQYLGEDKKPLPQERRHPNEDLKTCGTKHVAYAVDDLKGLIARFGEMGGDVVMPPFPMHENLVSFVRDNSGILLEFIEEGGNRD